MAMPFAKETGDGPGRCGKGTNEVGNQGRNGHGGDGGLPKPIPILPGTLLIGKQLVSTIGIWGWLPTL